MIKLRTISSVSLAMFVSGVRFLVPEILQLVPENWYQILVLVPVSGQYVMGITNGTYNKSARRHIIEVYVSHHYSIHTHLHMLLRCFSTLRQLCTIRRSVPLPVFQLLVVALVLARLDYCNSVLINLPASLIQLLQSVQNAAARLTFKSGSSSR